MVVSTGSTFLVSTTRAESSLSLSIADLICLATGTWIGHKTPVTNFLSIGTWIGHKTTVTNTPTQESDQQPNLSKEHGVQQGPNLEIG